MEKRVGRKPSATLSVKYGREGKECRKCGIWKPLDFFKKTKGQGIGECSATCKVCNGQKEKFRFIEGEYFKLCKDCSEWKPFNEFLKRSSSKHGICSICLDCGKLKSKKWRKENREKFLELRRRMYSENKEYYKVKAIERRTREMNLPYDWSSEDALELVEHFGGCCLTGDSNVEFDHIIPLSWNAVGTVRGNMIPLRKDLNRNKQAKNIFEWFKEAREEFELDEKKFREVIKYISDINGMTPEEYEKFVYGLQADFAGHS